MIELTRGLSFVSYTYEGGPLRFTVPFPYLLPRHLYVFVGDGPTPRLALGTMVDPTTIEIPPQDEFLTAPFTVTVRRVTPAEVLAVEFKDGANLPARDINRALRQLLFLHQEATEYAASGDGLPGGSPSGGLSDINTIIDAVTRSPAFEVLAQRIPEIDANAELIMDDILRVGEFHDIWRGFDARVTTAETSLSTTVTDVSALAQQYTSLVASVDGNTAAYAQLHQALADETQARADSITGLRTEFDQSNAAILQQLTAVSDAGGANTTWRQAFASQFGTGTTGDSVAAAVKQQIDTKATPAEAQSIADTSVTAFANGQFASLQQSYNAYVSSNDNKWAATWSLKVNGGDPANPVVAGIALSANPGGSDFVVMSDRFAIVTPTGTYGQRKFPFVVGTVGGVSTVGITGTLMVDGSITANKLSVTSLSAVTANAGTLNGGTFKTHTLDANGNIVDPLEFRAEMSNVGDWPIWVGSGAKTQNNAVFWVDRLGNAGFSGKVSAPNIVGVFQSAVAVNWVGSVSIPYSSNSSSWVEVHRFTLPPPVAVGEEHTPVLSLTVGAGPLYGGGVRLEVLNGTIWEVVSVVAGTTALVFPGGSDFHTHGVVPAQSGMTLSGAVAPTRTATTFRVMAANGPSSASSAPAANATSVKGFAFGVR